MGDFLQMAKILASSGITLSRFVGIDDSLLFGKAIESAAKVFTENRSSRPRLLDLGCGSAIPWIGNCHRFEHIYGIEFDPKAIAVASENLVIADCDLSRVTFFNDDVCSQSAMDFAKECAPNIVSANLPYLPSLHHEPLDFTVDGGHSGNKYVPDLILSFGHSVGAQIVVMNFSSIGTPKAVLARLSSESSFHLTHLHALCIPLGNYTSKYSDMIHQHADSIVFRGDDAIYQIIFGIILSDQSLSNSKLPPDTISSILDRFEQGGPQAITGFGIGSSISISKMDARELNLLESVMQLE